MNSPPKTFPALTLRQLQYFVTLTREHSFTQAAQHLSISQPALTAAIRQIEFLLGARLFDRSSHRLDLTEAGASMLPIAERLLNVALESIHDMTRTVTQGIQTVRIGLVPSVAERLFPHLRALNEAHPALRFALHDMDNADLIDSVRAGRVDFGVGVRELGAIGKGLICDDLFDDDIVAIVHAADTLARQGAIAWSQLSGRSLTVFARGNVADSLLRTVSAQGLLLEQAYRVEYTAPLYALVRNRMAVAVMPRLYLEDLHDPELVTVNLESPHLRRTIALLSARGGDRSPHVMRCREWVTRAMSGAATRRR